MWQAMMVLWMLFPLPSDGRVVLTTPDVGVSSDWWQRCEDAWPTASRVFGS
jgi:hypothetical protein